MITFEHRRPISPSTIDGLVGLCILNCRKRLSVCVTDCHVDGVHHSGQQPGTKIAGFPNTGTSQPVESSGPAPEPHLGVNGAPPLMARGVLGANLRDLSFQMQHQPPAEEKTRN